MHLQHHAPLFIDVLTTPLATLWFIRNFVGLCFANIRAEWFREFPGLSRRPSRRLSAREVQPLAGLQSDELPFAGLPHSLGDGPNRSVGAATVQDRNGEMADRSYAARLS